MTVKQACSMSTSRQRVIAGGRILRLPGVEMVAVQAATTTR
jgi:hypothetical protein